MIPPFDQRGLLPAGIYQASWVEVRAKFGFDQHRLNLIKDAQSFCEGYLYDYKGQLYLGGSLISNKVMPNDTDLTLKTVISYDNPAQMINAMALQSSKSEFKRRYNVDINMTLKGMADFVDLFQFVGDKHANLVGISPNERRGIIEVTPWKLG